MAKPSRAPPVPIAKPVAAPSAFHAVLAQGELVLRTGSENSLPAERGRTRHIGDADHVGGGGGRGARSTHGQLGTQMLWV